MTNLSTLLLTQKKPTPKHPRAAGGGLKKPNTLTLKKMDSREGAFVLLTHEVAKSTVTLREGAFKSQTYPNNHKHAQIHPKNTNPKILKNITKESKKIDCHESLRDSHKTR
ncbi:hypothetical protein [Helicobacter macacae]|nr:hypothetical protein [Helicobacter macacae]